MEVETLQAAITDLGRPYQQRDTLYKRVGSGEWGTRGPLWGLVAMGS